MARLPTKRRPYLPRRHSLPSQDSLNNVYVSVLPFVAGEYLIEANWSWSPTGIIFPAGFLLFWTFYFIYFRAVTIDPFNARNSNVSSFFSLMGSVFYWFIGSTLYSIFHPFGTSKTKRAKKRALPPRQTFRSTIRPVPNEPIRSLPAEVIESLKVLGLPENSHWDVIHKRYRSLAKQYHPDLHPELTDPALKFRRIDSAYRRLEQNRHLF